MRYRVIDDGRAYAVAEFTRSGITIRKHFRIRDNVHPDSGKPWSDAENARHAQRELMRKAREADRDIAYQLHGEDYRQYCEFKSNFWDSVTIDEAECLIGDRTQ